MVTFWIVGAALLAIFFLLVGMALVEDYRHRVRREAVRAAHYWTRPRSHQQRVTEDWLEEYDDHRRAS